MKYNIKDIPTLDPAEFSIFTAGRRAGIYFDQRIVDGVLDLGHTLGIDPVGKTRDSKVMSLSDLDFDTIAVMYQYQGMDERVWFHLVEEDSET